MGWTVAFVVVVGWTISICFHEFGHAIVAYWGGDTDVKEHGYLTLNPFRYTNPGLSLLFPILFLLIGGIALPGASVFINEQKLRSPLWNSAVSVAGPLANLLVAIGLAIALQANSNAWSWEMTAAISFLSYLQLYAVVINLLPIPSLDGYGIIRPLLDPKLRRWCDRHSRYGLLAALGVLWFYPPAGERLATIVRHATWVLQVDNVSISAGATLFQEYAAIFLIFLIAILAVGSYLLKWENPIDLIDQGDRLYREAKYEEAISAYQQAIERNSSSVRAWQWKAISLSNLSQHQEALHAIEKARQLDRDDVKLLFDLGHIYLRASRLEEAAKTFEEGLQIEPNNADAWFQYALTHYYAQRYDACNSALNKSLDIAPDRADSWELKGLIDGIRMDYQESVDAFNQAINLGCQKALVFNRKGISLLNLGAIDAAITSLKRACDIEPTVAEHQSYLGLGLAHSGRNKEAMSIYEKALSLNKDDAKTWFYYGCALYNSRNLELSLDALEKALSISPSLSKTWSLKGDIHCTKEDCQEALKAYDRSLESHVSFEVMQKKVYVLGTCLGRSDEVIEMYKSSLGLVEELLEKESVNVKFLHQKGYTLALMQRHEEARDIFIDILKLDPCHAYAWYNLACCYVSQEQIKLALDALSWAIAIEPIALSKSAKTDDSFEAIRESPAFQELVPS